jgi:hypothetical protein
MAAMNPREMPSDKIEILEMVPVRQITKVDGKDFPIIPRQSRTVKSSPKVATFPTDSNIRNEDSREDRNSQSQGRG